MIIMDMLISEQFFLIKSIVFYGIGINYYNINNNCMKTRHAEVDVIEKIKPLYCGKERNKCKKVKNLKKLNMLVFRTNKKGECLMNAKPCKNCLNYMKNINRKGYKIQKVYYTDNNNKIQMV
tara:strand:- start:744 stop:1109 length:366 start_codon:yes stop_codon:yes gene_type:complete